MTSNQRKHLLGGDLETLGELNVFILSERTAESVASLRERLASEIHPLKLQNIKAKKTNEAPLVAAF